MSEIMMGVLRMPEELFWADDPVTRCQHDQIRREAANEIDRLRADLERLRDQALHAVDAEPELPGSMPPEMAQAIGQAVKNEDMDFFVHALRLAVRMTKEGIRKRIMEQSDE